MLLVGWSVGLAEFSAAFPHDRPVLAKPVPLLVAFGMAAGAVYLGVLPLVRRPVGRGGWLWIVVVGLAMRLALVRSTVILEDDLYRYFWDGAVVAAGLNPYRWAPGEFADPASAPADAPPVLRDLAARSGNVIRRVNNAHLRSIYPAVAQGAFALGHWAGAWSVPAWRGVLLGFELAALVLLVGLLRRLDLPAGQVAVYWWNPLLVKEIYNSGHLEVVAFPFALGGLWLAIANRHRLAAGLFALGTGVKLWPVMLMGVLGRRLWGRPEFRWAASAFVAVFLVIMLPMILGGLGLGSGLTAYLLFWRNNSALYNLLALPGGWLARPFSAHPDAGFAVARVVLIFAAPWVFWRILRPAVRDADDFAKRCLGMVAALFLLSPAEFPWYYSWVLPFLALRPTLSLMLLTPLLWLYYLGWYCLVPRGLAAWFNYGLVWAEFVPVWLMLGWELRRSRRRPEPASGAPPT